MTSKAHSSSTCSPRKFDEKIALLKANESESNEKFERLLCELNVLKGHLNPSSRRTVSTPNVANASSGPKSAAAVYGTIVNDSVAAVSTVAEAAINSSSPVPIAAGGWYSTNAASAAAAAIVGNHFPAGAQYGGSNCNVSCTPPAAALTGYPSCPLVASSQFAAGHVIGNGAGVSCVGGGGVGGGAAAVYASSTQCTPKRRVRDMVKSRVQRSHPYSPTRDRFFPSSLTGADQQNFHPQQHQRPQQQQQQRYHQQQSLQHQQSQNQHQLVQDDDSYRLPVFPQPRRASSDTNIAERFQRCSPSEEQLADEQQQQLMAPQSAAPIAHHQQMGVQQYQQYQHFQQPLLLQDDMVRLSLGSFGGHFGSQASVSCSGSYAEHLGSAGATATVVSNIPAIQVTHSMCQSPTLYCGGEVAASGIVAEVPEALSDQQDQLGLFETDEDMNNSVRRDSYTMAAEVLASLGGGGGIGGVDETNRQQQQQQLPPPTFVGADGTLLL